MKPPPHGVRTVTEGLSDIAECLSPLRGEKLSNGVYSATATDESVFNTQNAIIGRDRADCCGADLIFMNLLGAKKVSIGTMVELAWADASRKPVIVCIEKHGNPHDSEYVRGLATYVVSSLDEGIAVARCFFNARRQRTLHGPPLRWTWLDDSTMDLSPGISESGKKVFSQYGRPLKVLL